MLPNDITELMRYTVTQRREYSLWVAYRREGTYPRTPQGCVSLPHLPGERRKSVEKRRGTKGERATEGKRQRGKEGVGKRKNGRV